MAGNCAFHLIGTTSTYIPQYICPYLQFCLVKLLASTWHRPGKLQAQRIRSETGVKELYPTSAFGILQIVLALPQYSLAGCHFPGLECQNRLCALPFFPFNCFITRLTYQHTQPHMLAHILCTHASMYLIHMHFILLCQIGFEYQQPHKNNLQSCTLKDKRQKSQS